MSASQPLLAVSLHELDCHGMLGMVVNVLHGLRQRHDKQLSSLPELLEVRVVSCRVMSIACAHFSSVI
jgi:D-alanine-D-alanine ligase-like ATP-grasp enzyme